jgi:hypothetical protein
MSYGVDGLIISAALFFDFSSDIKQKVISYVVCSKSFGTFDIACQLDV